MITATAFYCSVNRWLWWCTEPSIFQLCSKVFAAHVFHPICFKGKQSFTIQQVLFSWLHVIEILIMHMYICRTKDRFNHLFIHLNLSIALALGLVVFLAGIENATKHRVSYNIHCIYMYAFLEVSYAQWKMMTL